MKIRHCETLKATLETEGRFQLTRHEVFEMHLVDRNNRRESALCGVCAPDDKRMGVAYYLEMRKDGFGVGTVCEGCKVKAVQFAVDISRELKAEGQLDEAADYSELADRLAKETGQDDSRG